MAVGARRGTGAPPDKAPVPLASGKRGSVLAAGGGGAAEAAPAGRADADGPPPPSRGPLRRHETAGASAPPGAALSHGLPAARSPSATPRDTAGPTAAATAAASASAHGCPFGPGPSGKAGLCPGASVRGLVSGAESALGARQVATGPRPGARVLMDSGGGMKCDGSAARSTELSALGAGASAAFAAGGLGRPPVTLGPSDALALLSEVGVPARAGGDGGALPVRAARLGAPRSASFQMGGLPTL